jgi:hypothetical protein
MKVVLPGNFYQDIKYIRQQFCPCHVLTVQYLRYKSMSYEVR